jgi:hypothetical protein
MQVDAHALQRTYDAALHMIRTCTVNAIVVSASTRQVTRRGRCEKRAFSFWTENSASFV